MRTTNCSFARFCVISASLAVALLLTPRLQVDAQAQLPCGPLVGAPECDGYCPPTEACRDIGGGLCECVPSAGEPCGIMAGAPQCWGECPPVTPICVIGAGPGGCECVVPTLSEWSIIAMSLVMFGGVLHLRRRRAERA